MKEFLAYLSIIFSKILTRSYTALGKEEEWENKIAYSGGMKLFRAC